MWGVPTGLVGLAPASFGRRVTSPPVRIEAAFKAETIGREPVGGWLVARKTLVPRFHADDSDRPARRTHESDQMCLCSATARAD
jgi:hypothetical protein